MAASSRSKKSSTSKPAAKTLAFVATRKGAWVLESDDARKTWALKGPHFLGNTIHHMVLDPRDKKTLLAAVKAGHLGPTIFRSSNLGKSWTEASKPPAFPKAPEGQKGRVVDHTFWLTPGHVSQPGVWWAATSPHGLFRSADHGATWEPVPGLNDDPQYREWMGGEQDGTPDGPKLHSVIVDPRDSNHMYLGMSSGGVHESLDGGKSWKPLVKGMEVVDGISVTDISAHDPHCVRMSPSDPNRLYQQNHCGIYRIDRPSTEWVRVGKAMPKKVGDIGFPMTVHPTDANVAWVFPMDGQTVWPRTSPDGKPAVYGTANGGKSWTRMDAGFPREQAWWTVMRQAMTADSHKNVGLYLGNTAGEVWASRDGGGKWSCIARHLPEIFAVETAVL
jgi:photosystem II stability/assembly factor-like uncharacterized protein